MIYFLLCFTFCVTLNYHSLLHVFFLKFLRKHPPLPVVDAPKPVPDLHHQCIPTVMDVFTDHNLGLTTIFDAILALKNRFFVGLFFRLRKPG